jgi:ligand-binding sensor domain-containing protein
MLVGTLGSGIAVFEKSPFKRDTIKTILSSDNYLINPYVSQITSDKDGNLWIFTDGGITEWIFKDGFFSKAVHQPNLGQLGKINIYRAVFADSGVIYLATELGLIKKNNDQYEIIYPNSSLKKEPVFWCFRDNEKRIWFPTLKNLYYLKDGIVNDFSKTHPEITASAVAYCQDLSGSLRIGVLGKIFLFNKNQLEIIDEKNGLNKKSIISLFSDNENNLWIGSLEGISKLTNTNLKFVKNTELQTYYTSAVSKIGGKLLIGTNTDLYEIKNYTLVESDLTTGIGKASYNRVVHSNNNIWFATDKGVYLKTNNAIKHFTVADGLPNDFVYNFVRDSSGVVWIATQSGLAYYKNGKIFNFENNIEKNWKFSDKESKKILSTISIRWLIVDENNAVWVGSWDSGLFRIKDDSIYRFIQKDGLKDLHIRAFYIDTRKRLWVGTRYGGAFIFENNSFRQISSKDGLGSNWIFSILEDDWGNYWFSTANGINKFNGKDWIKIDASDGITSGEIKFSTKDGRDLWFGSWSQVFCYQTDSVNTLGSKPEIYFTQIRTLNGELPINQESGSNPFRFEDLSKALLPEKKITELSYNNNTLFIEFAGPSFRDETKTRYDYILEGFDKEWIKSTRRNYATYTHLPPGDYSFKVYTINGYGIKSNSPAEFTFTILPPFWQTWWFISSVVFLSLFITSAISIFLYRLRATQKLRVERMRTKIATDLHDDIGTSLSSIAIFSQLAKRKVNCDTGNAGEYLEKIETTSRNLIDAMSDIVWSINPLNDSLEDAFLKMKDYSVKILEAKNIEAKFFISENIGNINLQPDVRRNLLLIFKEAVTNAAKHSEASEVEIALDFDETTGDKIIFTIADNGIGFDAENEFNGNGLKNIKRRSDEVKAELELISSPGNGTKITVKMPVD